MQRSYVLLLLLLSASINVNAMEQESKTGVEETGWESLQEILNEPREKSIDIFLQTLNIQDDVESPSAIRQALTAMSPKNFKKLVSHLAQSNKTIKEQKQELANILIYKQLQKTKKYENSLARKEQLLTQKEDENGLLKKLVQKQRKQCAGCIVVAMLIFAYAFGVSVYTLPLCV